MPPAGRPRTFDRDEALKKAMYIFWEKGYEGTSMTDLIGSIGMKAPSIYAAFGNKDELFREVVSHYLPIILNGQLAILNDTPGIIDAVEKTLCECVRLFTCDDNPHTCLIMTAAINASPEHQEHVESLKSLRKFYKETWVKRFERAAEERQLKEDLIAKEIAEYFVTVIQGMALSSKDGASKEELAKTSEIALQILK